MTATQADMRPGSAEEPSRVTRTPRAGYATIFVKRTRRRKSKFTPRTFADILPG